MLLDISVKDASRLYKFYLNHERLIPGVGCVSLFLFAWEYVGGIAESINPFFRGSPLRILKVGQGIFAFGEISSMPGLSQGLGRAPAGVVVGELYAATARIGFMITVAGATFQTDKVLVGVLLIAMAGVFLTRIEGAVEQRFDKWRPGFEG